ncbi:CFC_collapsed_G0047660.mRNA.1.CDS.1 [Saccharomyces cerevisiae]|nr:CFC_collapsed_G0047660.mRNA.1.CDS.1 [Saccharomyces cerevisiae]
MTKSDETTATSLNAKTLKSFESTLRIPTYPREGVKQRYCSSGSRCIPPFPFSCFHAPSDAGAPLKGLVHMWCWFNEGRCTYARMP